LDTDIDILEVATVPTPSPPPTPSPTPVPMDPAAAFVVAPPAASQGEPVVVRVRAPGARQVVVALDPRTVPLFPLGGGTFAGVLAVPMDTPPGVHQLHATAVAGDGGAAAWTADLTVWDARFPRETVTLTEKTVGLLDAALREQELRRLEAVWTLASPERMWSGPWTWPVAPAVASGFGARRTYIPGSLPGRHTGVDLRGGAGTVVAAPAPGRVALAEELTARGGTVVLDHGWGVFSAYFHLGRIGVAAGDTVTQGDSLGETGATGMVTGPHLHWEVRVMGVAVRPSTWVRGVATAVP
ncbi:MAG: M23 family metallopeptidase, partial [Anaerolineae bacterium]